ncbi:hypothetical protein [Microbacterium maritypicum]|uniref:hypothetical protein n=1 Tax=Microbacterium maritypicum TaxID=33918 RepID=UPI0022E26684|nr:hypothetical protein [Microbacterium liquefaciens]
MDLERDAQYRELLLAPLRTSASYLPKMGGGVEVDLAGFSALYGADPLYHWIGFDSPLMFAAHKAAGGMTSLYRQLGIGSERLIRQIFRDELGLTEEQVRWSYSYEEDGRTRTLTLDGRLEASEVSDPQARDRLVRWIDAQRAALGISVDLKGAIFEIRQGYKSADSKRQNADLANAAQALGYGYLPVLAVMSTQINNVVRTRYRVGRWCVLLGSLSTETPDAGVSTFDFIREVVGYDLVAFFERNAAELRADVEQTLTQLLEAR